MTITTQQINRRVVEAWGIIERAEHGDCLAVAVALDNAMDATGLERDAVKRELYRHVALLITQSATQYEDQSVATTLTLYLYDGNVKDAKLFMQGYGVDREWEKKTKRLVKLCSWVESTP